MSPELEQRLYNAFPVLYRLHHLDSPQMCCGWEGIRCNDGWYELIRKLSRQIAKYARRHNLDPLITGVSRRGGALRVELDGADENIRLMCGNALEKSLGICEICGEPGKPVSDQPYDIRVSCLRHSWERDDRPLADDEFGRLRAANEKLYKIGLEMLEEGLRLAEPMAVRVEDPLDPMDDFEIDATLTFILREDDPDFREDDDNILTTRDYHIPKSRIEKDGSLGFRDWYLVRYWHEGVECHRIENPCYIFHDLYCHEYGSGKQHLSMRDILRIGDVWIDIDVQAQMFRNLEEIDEEGGK